MSIVTKTYRYGEGLVLPTKVVKDGYDFVGWYDNKDLTGNAVLSIGQQEDGDKYFYAKLAVVKGSDPTLDDPFLKSLADWGLSSERPSDLPEPSLSDNLMKSNYILNDGYVDDSGTYISVDTVAKIKDNLDKLSTVNFPWMIWGYDIDIPEYVKYRNGDDFVYLRSVQDVSSDWNVAGSLVEDFVGKEIFECSWNSELYKREYTAINVVGIVSGEKFTYGNNNTYSVPQNITDNNGKEYTFCGHTATLHSKNLVTSTNDNGTTMYVDLEFRYVFISETEGSNEYRKSIMRHYINSRVGYSEFIPTAEMTMRGIPRNLAKTNGFVAKLFGSKQFLKRITNQVNVVWNERHPTNPDICIDEVGLIPCGQIGFIDPLLIPVSCDTSICSLYSSERIDENRIKYSLNIDGSENTDDSLSTYYGYGHWWLRSAAVNLSAFWVGMICRGSGEGGGVFIDRGGRAKGCSPLIVLG